MLESRTAEVEVYDTDDDGKGDFVVQAANGKRVYVSINWLIARLSLAVGAIVTAATAIYAAL